MKSKIRTVNNGKISEQLAAELDKLKVALVESDDFGHTFNTFMDVTTNMIEELLDASRNMRDEILEQIIKHATARAVSIPPETVNVRPQWVEQKGFYHGPVITSKFQGAFLYFQDLGMGMVALGSMGASDVQYIRFSGEVVPEGTFTGNKFSTTVH